MRADFDADPVHHLLQNRDGAVGFFCEVMDRLREGAHEPDHAIAILLSILAGD